MTVARIFNREPEYTVEQESKFSSRGSMGYRYIPLTKFHNPVEPFSLGSRT